MKFPFRRMNQKGDTIVEVLIAIAIVSTVLLGAFQVTQRSSMSVRGGQEHSEMLQILHGQVEQVRAIALAQQTDEGGIFAKDDFCIDTSGPIPQPADSSADVCKKMNSLYGVSISHDEASNTFIFKGSWSGMDGNQKQEQLSYRVYSGQPIDSGAVGIGIKGCNIDPLTGLCKLYPNPQYRWTIFYTNTSNNPGVTVNGCKWVFDDGSTETDSCNFGDVQPHPWTPQPVAPYNADCYKYPHSVTLTMFLSNGTSPQTTYSKNIPQCY